MSPTQPTQIAFIYINARSAIVLKLLMLVVHMHLIGMTCISKARRTDAFQSLHLLLLCVRRVVFSFDSCGWLFAPWCASAGGSFDLPCNWSVQRFPVPFCISPYKQCSLRLGFLALLLGARTLLGAPGRTTRSKNATRGSWP